MATAEILVPTAPQDLFARIDEQGLESVQLAGNVQELL